MLLVQLWTGTTVVKIRIWVMLRGLGYGNGLGKVHHKVVVENMARVGWLRKRLRLRKIWNCLG